MKLVPLQLKIKNSYGEIRTYANNNRVMYIHSDDKELFRKCREILNKITELIGINEPKDYREMYTKIHALLEVIIEIIKM